MIRKIGVLTGGGDCPGLNAVIRAVVRAAHLKFGWEVIGIEDGFDGLVFSQNLKPLNLEAVSGILHIGGTILGTTNRGNPFKHVDFKDGKKEVCDLSPRIIENVRILGLDAIVCIGGDGTLSIAHDLFELGVPVVGVPKTIDNDISATDLTFGFTTAVDTATDALDKLHTTAESHHRVMVVEVMGRDSGWIALECGIAGGADVILIPEIPFDIEKVCERVKQRYILGKRFSIVVVAEGAKALAGQQIIISEADDEYQNVRLGGISYTVAAQIEKNTSIETRVVVLGHLQRGGSPNAFDRSLATKFGAAAVGLIADGKFGYMTALAGRKITSVRIDQAVKVAKRVDPRSDDVRTAEMLGIQFGRDEPEPLNEDI